MFNNLIHFRYSGRFDCGCKYVFKATIHDYNNELLEQHDYYDVLRQWEADRWIKVCLFKYMLTIGTHRESSQSFGSY